MTVVQRLVAEGAEVVVVEQSEGNRHLAQLRGLGVPVLIADGTQPQTLASVSLASAAAVAILTSDDLANLETGLAVRDQLGDRRASTPVVLRMFDPQLCATWPPGPGCWPSAGPATTAAWSTRPGAAPGSGPGTAPT